MIISQNLPTTHMFICYTNRSPYCYNWAPS